MSRFAEQMVRCSVHRIVERAAPKHINVLRAGASEDFLSAWREIESQFTSSSLGVIAEAGDGMDAISQLLLDGEAGGEVPGAIVLIGFDSRLPKICLRLVNKLGCSPQGLQSRNGLARRAIRPIPFDWPPLVIFLPANDPDLAACGRACREMRAAGMSIRLEVMDASLGLGSANASLPAVAELVREIDDHFSTHLAPVFPKLI